MTTCLDFGAFRLIPIDGPLREYLDGDHRPVVAVCAIRELRDAEMIVQAIQENYKEARNGNSIS